MIGKKDERVTIRYPLFTEYKRDWLHEVTGYSTAYLCRIATGKTPLTRAFIERVCFKLKQPEAKLFLPDTDRQPHCAYCNNPVNPKWNYCPYCGQGRGDKDHA